MSSVKKNFAYNAAYQMLLIVLPLITTPYISRVLGSEGLGAYTYTYTIANYFVLAAMLGVKNYGNRSVAAVREDRDGLSRVFSEIYGLQFLCSVAVLGAYGVYVAFFSGEYRLIALIQGIYVLSGLADISWFFFGLEKFKITVSRNILIRLIDLACIFLFVKDREDLWIYALIMTLGIFFSQSYLWFYIFREINWKKPCLSGIKRHLVPELILFVPIIAVSLYTMMDKVMLGAMSSMSQVGFYEGASKILNIPTGLITALGTVMLPRMSNLVAKGRVKESERYIHSSMIFAMFLAFGMMFGIAGIAQDFVPVFLGREYESSVQLIWVMSPVIPFIAWANVIRTQYLIPNHRDRSYIISVVLGAVINLGVNALLIPSLDAMGAVIGTICAEGTVCVSQTVMIRHNLGIRVYLKDTAPFIICGGSMLLGIQLLHHLISEPCGSAVTLAAEIFVGGTVYVILSGIWYCRSHRKEVAEMVKQIRSRKK